MYLSATEALLPRQSNLMKVRPLLRLGAAVGATMLSALGVVAGPSTASGETTGVGAALTPWRLPAPLYRTVAVVSDGKIYVLGGHDSAGGTVSVVYSFGPATGRSALAGTLALPTHGSAAALVGGKILVFGGASAYVDNTVQQFVPVEHSAKVVGYLPGARADTTAATVGDETVLVGGFDGYGPQSAVWAATKGTDFRVLAHLPQPVRYPAVGVLGPDVYVFGGLIYGGEYNGDFTNDVQVVDVPAGTARIAGHLPMPLAHAMGAKLGGNLYVIGGSAPWGPSAQVLEFHPAGGVATLAGKLPEPVTDAAVASIGPTAYVLGGISANGPVASILSVTLRRRG